MYQTKIKRVPTIWITHNQRTNSGEKVSLKWQCNRPLWLLFFGTSSVVDVAIVTSTSVRNRSPSHSLVDLPATTTHHSTFMTFQLCSCSPSLRSKLTLTWSQNQCVIPIWWSVSVDYPLLHLFYFYFLFLFNWLNTNSIKLWVLLICLQH